LNVDCFDRRARVLAVAHELRPGESGMDPLRVAYLLDTWTVAGGRAQEPARVAALEAALGRLRVGMSAEQLLAVAESYFPFLRGEPAPQESTA
jgi:hypothetical protein